MPGLEQPDFTDIEELVRAGADAIEAGPADPEDEHEAVVREVLAAVLPIIAGHVEDETAAKYLRFLAEEADAGLRVLGSTTPDWVPRR